MAKCIRCGKSTLVKGHVKLADCAICTPCFKSLGFKLTDTATASMYKYDEIKDGRDAYNLNKQKDRIRQAALDSVSVKVANYGQARDLICTEQEREIYDTIRSLMDDYNLDSDLLRLVRKSDNYVSVVIGDTDVARIKYTNRAKWIWTYATDKVNITTTEDVVQLTDALIEGFRQALKFSQG